MGKFSESLRHSGKVKNHRAGKAAKIEIREHVLASIGKAHVFDAFAGTGAMFDAVWSKAESYVGCDLDWTRDERLAYVADNRRVLRAIDLAPFNVFDLDAFGSPWEQAIIVAARRPVAKGERVGLLLTDGSGLALKQNNMPKALAELAGLRGKPAGMNRWQDDLIDMALAGLIERMGVSIEKRWQAHRTAGAAVRYIGLILRGVE